MENDETSVCGVIFALVMGTNLIFLARGLDFMSSPH